MFKKVYYAIAGDPNEKALNRLSSRRRTDQRVWSQTFEAKEKKNCAP